MKKIFFIAAFIAATFIVCGCTANENFDYKLTIVTESESQAVTPDNLSAAAGKFARG